VRAESRSLAETFLVEDVMVAKEKLETLPHGTTISKALRASFNSLQPLFLVTVGDEPQGVVFREEILEHAATTPDDYISAIVFRDLPSIDVRAPLSQALALLEEEQSHVALVTRDGVFAGIASYDRVADFLLMKGVRNHFPPEEETEWPTPP
jgi:CBS domain containing-hemolysin-like protein